MQLFTTTQAARHLNVTPGYLRQITLASGIDASRRTAGGHRRFSADDVRALAAWLERSGSARSLPANTEKLWRIARCYAQGLLSDEVEVFPIHENFPAMAAFAKLDALSKARLRTHATEMLSGLAVRRDQLKEQMLTRADTGYIVRWSVYHREHGGTDHYHRDCKRQFFTQAQLLQLRSMNAYDAAHHALAMAPPDRWLNPMDYSAGQILDLLATKVQPMMWLAAYMGWDDLVSHDLLPAHRQAEIKSVADWWKQNEAHLRRLMAGTPGNVYHEYRYLTDPRSREYMDSDKYGGCPEDSGIVRDYAAAIIEIRARQGKSAQRAAQLLVAG
jgi:DNA-binding transcriptional MerR regulator